MPTRPFDFTNSAGHTLSGRLELPVGPPHAWALFAHCFTCGKDNLAAVRIARRLAGSGIGVLRFDFTGLGHSEGDFADTDFSLNIEDLVAADKAMAAADMAPTLAIGHSLGGAAVLAAARLLPDVRAVVAIAAPFDAAHVIAQMTPDKVAEIERGGRADVLFGGRPFTVGKQFLDDVREQDQGPRIAALGRPLLLLHSPSDKVVGIDNATRIFVTAHHPKSFVSLDGADHLLSKSRDADFAADVIAAWSSRYLPEPVQAAASDFDAEAEETGMGKFQLAMRAGQAAFIADEPVSVGGLGSGPSPYDLLCAGLAACTTMTLRQYATAKGWPVERIRTAVAHRKEAGASPPDVFTRRITVEGAVDEEQRTKLAGAADRCPVHRTLEQGSRFDSVEVRITTKSGDA